MEANTIKHPLPMKLADGNRHIYPTTIDMVYAEDGTTPIFDKKSGDWTANNALNLGGRPAEDYALKDEGGGTGVPAGGSAGQTMVKQSDEDGDAVWANPNLTYSMYEDPDEEVQTGDPEILPIVADDAEKLGGKAPSHYENKITSITANGQTVQPDANGAVDLGTIGRSNLEINDETPSETGVYSSKKVEDVASQLSQQIAGIDGKCLPLAGGEMTGPIKMAGNVVEGLGNAVKDDDAVSLGFMKDYYPSFKAYYIVDSDDGYTPYTILQKYWDTFSLRSFVAYAQNKGTPRIVIGYKASNTYGAYLSISQDGMILYGLSSSGWTETRIK